MFNVEIKPEKGKKYVQSNIFLLSFSLYCLLHFLFLCYLKIICELQPFSVLIFLHRTLLKLLVFMKLSIFFKRIIISLQMVASFFSLLINPDKNYSFQLASTFLSNKKREENILSQGLDTLQQICDSISRFCFSVQPMVANCKNCFSECYFYRYLVTVCVLDSALTFTS